jgi:hypothetical protein
MAKKARGRSQKEYDTIFDQLWNELVPASGQASTIQGELIRCSSRLTSEAMRNGNVNWDRGFRIMTEFLEKHLLDGTFDGEIASVIEEDIEAVQHAGSTGENADDAHYLRLVARAVDWCLAHPDQVPHKTNVKLKR